MGFLASKEEVLRHFHGHSVPRVSCRKLLATVPEAGCRVAPGFGRAVAWPRGRSAGFPPNGCRYSGCVVGKVLEKMPCQVVLMKSGWLFSSSANVAKIADGRGAGGFPRSRMGSPTRCRDNSVSKVVMTVLRQMLTRESRRVARNVLRRLQACSGACRSARRPWLPAQAAFQGFPDLLARYLHRPWHRRQPTGSAMSAFPLPSRRRYLELRGIGKRYPLFGQRPHRPVEAAHENDRRLQTESSHGRRHVP